MLLYAYYNADLMDIAKGKSELPTGFMDDCAFVAVADTIDETHVILKNMIEHTNSGLDWSLNHNSPFELSKQAVMNFTRDTQDIATSPLQLSVFSHFSGDWPVSGRDIIGVSNGPADPAAHITIMLVTGRPTVGLVS